MEIRAMRCCWLRPRRTAGTCHSSLLQSISLDAALLSLSSQCRKRACIVSPERRQPRRGYGCDDAQFARHFGDLQLIGAAPARSITAGVLARQRCTSHVASVFDEKVRKLLLRGESCGSVR
ncbi:unnamed protein product [Hermetia illucens]|uniref:Uncharacterized protein n=2 Tax=Hermetia illucens TaxID=343691 RepID=A0A7R8YWR5_HERIL|nr:unnamed protein product [Hermetia illucens]